MATIPSLALLPSGYKASKVYSVLPTDGTGDFDFTRSGNATRVNSEGLIELVTTNVPRLNYPLIDGVVQGCPSLLLEPSGTNLVTYSEDFSNAYWSKTNSSIQSNQVISPDGTLNADKLVENTTNAVHQINASTSVTGNDYSFSVFVKKGEREFVSLVLSDNTRYLSHYTFDLTNGVTTKSYDYSGVTSTFTSILIGNGWYKLTLSSNYTWNTLIYTRIYIENTATPATAPANSYLGDGTSGIYIFGAQLEQGSYPTSYIPNSGTALGVTRSAETCNNAGDVNTFNDSEGVLFAEISALDDDGTARYIAISDGSINERVQIIYSSISDNIAMSVVSSNTGQASATVITSQTQNSKFAIKYKVNDCSFWFNGFKIATDTSAVMPSGLDTLAFRRPDNTSQFYGKTKQLQYFDSALTDSELETLTSWVSFSDMATSQLYTIE
jgi:hypothetical protein